MEIKDQEQKRPDTDSGIVSRKFRGIWIPSTIWLNPKLNMIHKVFLAEIESLSGDQSCFASNAYFGISKRYASKIISELSDMGLIKIKLIYKADSKEVDRRVIRCVGYENPIEMIVKVVHEKEPNETPESLKKRVVYIVDLLNGLTGGSFRATTESTKSHIVARLNEGATISDFELVIRDRFARWNQDPKMREYLRPSTLFGTKFESYLNAAKTQPAPQSNRPAVRVDHGSLFGERQNETKA